MEDKTKQPGWEIPIPELFLNPFFWLAALAIIAWVVYNIWFSPSKNNQVFQTTNTNQIKTP